MASTRVGGARIEFFFGLQRVKFANGFEWRITPNPAATTGEVAFSIRGPVYSRDLIVRDANRLEVPHGACRDNRNRATSHGGLVPVLNEPGTFMQCQNGRRVESVRR